MLVERSCEQCLGPYPAQASRRTRFCSRTCKMRWHGPSALARKRLRSPEFRCPACGDGFRSADAKAKYCSARCRNTGRAMAPCASCGTPTIGGTCASCRAGRLAQRRVARENRAAEVARRRLERMRPRMCRGCGIQFIPTAGPSLAARQVFHDAACRERAGRRREDVVEHRRRAKLVRRRFRAMIYERDRSRCYLCRQIIDQAIRFPDPRSPTIDHVMPYSAGGSDDPSNLRAAHLGCNQDKGDRLPYWWEKPA